MPLDTSAKSPIKFPDPEFLTLESWKKGVISLIDKSRLPKDALETATNCFLYEDGQPGPRPGVDWYGQALPNGAVIDGVDYFDNAGTISLVACGGGVVYHSLNDGVTWTVCTGATPTAGLTVNMLQSGAYLYLTNGTNNIIRYDGSTTLVTYTTLTTPVAATKATTPSSPGTGFTYYYKIAEVNTVGFTLASPSVTVVHGVPREAWDSTTNFVTLTLPAYEGAIPGSGQTRFDIFLSTDDLNYYYLDSLERPNLIYKDNGTALIIPSTLAPVSNTTQGPLVKQLTNVGARMFGVRDTDNPYRIWFSGSGNFAGSFSNAYDGGYLNWQTGGKYRPVQVEDYRDGKGTPLATIWCSSADGLGCVLQMSLDTETVGDISVTVPSAYQLPGSRGTPAPYSVVNVLNDYMFYNSQAFYNLGSRAQFLNLLSTDESSANIRPDVRNISPSAESGIASTYFEGRVFFSVPYFSSTNNYTAVWDTEKKAWLPKAFSLGFSRFLRYTDTGSGRRLLALKPGDNRLSQISTTIYGDYGLAFDVEIATGLYPVTKNRFEFQFTEEGEVEFSNPRGDISVELVGIERVAGYSTIGTKTIPDDTSTSLTTGWNSFDWDSRLWDYTDDISLSSVTSDSSLKRYFIVQRELNAAQWRITSSNVNASWVLRSLQTWGTPTQADKPRDWLLT